jgi:hypothetical protein
MTQEQLIAEVIPMLLVQTKTEASLEGAAQKEQWWTLHQRAVDVSAGRIHVVASAAPVVGWTLSTGFSGLGSCVLSKDFVGKVASVATTAVLKKAGWTPPVSAVKEAAALARHARLGIFDDPFAGEGPMLDFKPPVVEVVSTFSTQAVQLAKIAGAGVLAAAACYSAYRLYYACKNYSRGSTRAFGGAE